MKTKVNIVMLVKDRVRLTNQALHTLFRNTPRELFNLTLIDDESSPSEDWRPSLNYLDKGVACLRVQQSKGVTAMVRNLGVYWPEKYWERGQYLYLSDNDVYFTPGWLENLLMAAEKCEPNVRLLGGWNHPFHLPNETLSLLFGREVHVNHALAGPSQLMRWQVWDSYGPLQHGAPGVCQGEDDVFSAKIVADAGKVGVIWPDVVLNTGLTNSHGQPAPGADLVLKELEAAKATYGDLIWN